MARTPPSRLLRVSPEVLRDLRDWAERGHPAEACGLLVGRRRADTCTEVVRAVRAENLAADRAGDRYEVDPGDHLAAEEAARSEGLSVVGVWHSHPDRPARPSVTDRASAWEGWSYVIVSLEGSHATAVRSWRLDAAGAFVEEEIRMRPW
jgi:proteasome lid subunit RPN8/RPN11